MTWPTAGLRVSTSGVAASTETVSASSPMAISITISGLALTCRTIPVRWNVRNPERARLQSVRSGGQVGENVVSACVGHSRPDEVGVGLGRRHVDARQDGPARVAHSSADLRGRAGLRPRETVAVRSAITSSTGHLTKCLPHPDSSSFCGSVAARHLERKPLHERARHHLLAPGADGLQKWPEYTRRSANVNTLTFHFSLQTS